MQVRTQVGRSWQSSFQICVEVAAVSAPPSGSNGEQRKASVSSVRNELASNIWFITPAGYKLLGYAALHGLVVPACNFHLLRVIFQLSIKACMPQFDSCVVRIQNPPLTLLVMRAPKRAAVDEGSVWQPGRKF
jgi:hypothetical protein